MCKIASKKLISRPLTVTQKPLLDVVAPLPLQLVTPPALDHSSSTTASTSSSLSASCPNPGYFDILPPLHTPRFTPSALLDSLDYTFPSPAVVPSVTAVGMATAPVVVAPFDQFITSTTSSSDNFESSSCSPSDEEAQHHEYHPWHPHHLEELLEEEEDNEDVKDHHHHHLDDDHQMMMMESGIVDSSVVATTVAPRKTVSAPLPARTPVSCSSAASAIAKAGTSGVVKKTVTSEEKRERNRLAAERYRKKGRDTITYLDQQREDLTKKNSDLQLRNEQLEREVAFLKETLAKHGLLVKAGRC